MHLVGGVLQGLDRHAGEPFQDLAGPGEGGAHHRILAGGVAEAGEARHVGHQGHAREADAEVVQAVDHGEQLDVGAAAQGHQGEGADADRLQDRAQDQGAEEAQPQGAEAPDRDAGDRGPQAEGAAHGGHLDLGEAHVVVERIDDRPPEIVRQMVEGDRQQHDQGEQAVGLEELDEWPRHRIEEALGRPQGRGMRLGVHHRVRLARLLGQEARAHPDHHGRRRGEVGNRPAGELSQEQDQGVGAVEGGAIAQLIGRGHQAQFFGRLGRLDAPGVDDDVLGRGGEGGGDRAGGERADASARPDQGHAGQGRADADLRQHHPAAPPAEPAEQGHIDPVDHRRPQELERIGQAHP